MIIIILLCLAAFIWGVYVYNTLIKQQNQVKEGWSGVDVQLKRRHDLVPNLVESVKAYAGHESKVFEEVTELRTRISQTDTIQEKGELESALSLGLNKLLAVAENYPNLKANENFIQLQQELASIEEQIQLARRYYNGTVRDYNTSLQSFPQIIIGSYFQFDPYDYFEISEEKERDVPRVDFNKEKE